MTEVAASIVFLRERIAGLDRQRVSLVRALEVLQGESPPSVGESSPPLDSASGEEDPPTRAAQILGVLRKSGPLTRREILRAFEGAAVKASSLDSTVYRLKARGLIVKRGARFAIPESQVVAGPGAEAVASSAPDRSTGPVRAPIELGAPQVQGDRRVVPVAEDRAAAAAAPPEPVPDEDHAGPLTVRVCQAVVTGVAGTRRDLVRHFAPQGFSESAVDAALSGLRKRGKLRSVGRGAIVVVGSGASSETAEPESQGA